ncbi:MAG: AraC family transcriptional regulator [Bacteroidales bacterium]|nr:MAG: AraC family transcriptional regulator [Bacteroidales bacterium]
MINILIIGIFEGIFLAMLILTKKKKSVSDFILAVFFLAFAINIFLSYIEAYNRQNGFPYPWFIFTAAPFLLLHGPILWLYIKSLTDQYFRFKAIYLLNLIPFAGMILQHSIEIYSIPVNERIAYVLSETFKQSFTYPVFLLLIAFSQIVYFYFGLKLIVKYKGEIEGYFSQTIGIDLKWLNLGLKSWILLSVFVNSFFIIDLFVPIATFGLLQFLSFIIASVYLVFIGFYGIKQENLFLTKTIDVNLEKTLMHHPEGSPIKPLREDEKAFIQTLLDYMRLQKPYLQPEITLSMLSKELKVSSEYLSDIINTDLNKNFFDFINYYRVEEFKKQCKDLQNKNLNIIGIAYNCGFNSKATFNRVFKKVSGHTPSEYIERSQ